MARRRWAEGADGLWRRGGGERPPEGGTPNGGVRGRAAEEEGAAGGLAGDSRYSGTYGQGGTLEYSETFTYDSLGNRTNLNANGTANIDSMNQYIADGNSHTLTYDARGNLTGTWDYAYTYDQLNRMTSATPSNHANPKAVYTYDAQSRRTSETTYTWNSGTGAGTPRPRQ